MRRLFPSILSRVVWLHVVAITVASVALPAATYLLLHLTVTSHQNLTLRQHTDSIARYLDLQSDGRWTLVMPNDLRTLYEHGYDGQAFAVLDQSGRVLFSSLPAMTPVFTGDPLADHAKYFQRPLRNATYYGASIPVRRGPHRLWIQVAQNLDHPDVIVDDIADDFLDRIVWVILPIMLALLAIDIAIVRRALRPILHTSELAEEIKPTRLELRLPTGDLPREIVPLVHAFNQALDRIENGFRIQREFTADAAHELRTPLTVLRTRLDTLGNQPGVVALKADVDRMARIVNQLLEISELETFSLDPADKVDLHAIGAEVVAFIAPLALDQDKNVALTGTAQAIWIKGNAEALFRALRNLVENAIAHTPTGSTVEIEVDNQGLIRVLDQGPGVADEDRELIFQRFWRGDRRGSGGAGLGLSIVSRIVAAHGGRVTVGNRQGGGAVFSIQFDLVGAEIS